MAASNYMTETDTEAIWSKNLTTATFALIGVRIAEVLNFWVNDDATNQVTNTAVTPLMEQLSEQALIQLLYEARAQNTLKPGEYALSNAANLTTTLLFERGNKKILDKIRRILGNKQIELVRKTLPSSTTNW